MGYSSLRLSEVLGSISLKLSLLWIIYVISVFFFLLCFRARLFIDALWSPAGKWADLLALVCDVQF